MTKKIFFYLIIVLCTQIISSCAEEEKQPPEIAEDKPTATNIDSAVIKEELRKERRRKMLERERQDSLRMEQLLSEVLDRIEPSSFRTSFSDSFQLFFDSLMSVDVKIEYDFLLSRNQKHLAIRRFSPKGNQIDLFSLKDGKPTNILHYDMWSMAYLNDTLQDVNGDGLNDLVLNGYALSGCCLKAFSEVFLTKNDLRSFSPMFHFINPTFSGREGIIRGVCYGHLGETELYKFRWKNYDIDTVEYIAFERTDDGNRTGKVIISNHYPEHQNYKIIRTAPSVPAEYLKIEGFDWFANEFVKK
jgi:hypothetical protein